MWNLMSINLLYTPSSVFDGAIMFLTIFQRPHGGDVTEWSSSIHSSCSHSQVICGVGSYWSSDIVVGSFNSVLKLSPTSCHNNTDLVASDDTISLQCPWWIPAQENRVRTIGYSNNTQWWTTGYWKEVETFVTNIAVCTELQTDIVYHLDMSVSWWVYLEDSEPE